MNKSLLSKEIRSLIPLNSGMMIGNSKDIIKLTDLISTRFNCAGMFPYSQEQGLLNYLYLSGEINELGINIHLHSVDNGSLLSCPNHLPIGKYTQRINSNQLISVHHYLFMKGFKYKIKKNIILNVRLIIIFLD